jgi:nucleotide-binding universal stress UspA family protein
MMPRVKEMLRHFSADLTLVHAYGPKALANSELAIANPELPEQVRILKEQRLRGFALETFPGQHVETIAEIGEAGGVIHRVVQHQGTDLVMLATHGRGPIRRLLLGSVAAKVLHDVSAAVVERRRFCFRGPHPENPVYFPAVRRRRRRGSGSGSDGCRRVCIGYKALLSPVHVVETPPPNVSVDFSPYEKDLMNAADFKLRELKGKLGLDMPHAVLEGSVAETIHQEAVRRNADLIVTGRGRAQGTFHALWSRLYPIVRLSPCPVLSI